MEAVLILQWDKGSIRGLGWSEDEKLLVITADGTVRCYYDLQGDFTQFSLGNVSSCLLNRIMVSNPPRIRAQKKLESRIVDSGERGLLPY